jgi:hypothetical protein
MSFIYIVYFSILPFGFSGESQDTRIERRELTTAFTFAGAVGTL